MSEIDKNIITEKSPESQPKGMDYDQTLLEFLDNEFSKMDLSFRHAISSFVPLLGMLNGLKITARAIFSKKVTVQYPEEKLDVSDSFRGKHVLLTSPAGDQICICCNACALICPVDCITVRFEKSKDPESTKRVLSDYVVDLSRCMFCGLCQEQCPEFCLKLGPDYEYSDTNRHTGALNVRKDDIQRRCSENEWVLIKRKKTEKAAQIKGKTSTEAVSIENIADVELEEDKKQ